MGGHSAWRKRVARGEPAKGSGGAICRHRPHLGRKGKDIELNRKGNIGGGNPKKNKRKGSKEQQQQQQQLRPTSENEPKKRAQEAFIALLLLGAIGSLCYCAARRWRK